MSQLRGLTEWMGDGLALSNYHKWKVQPTLMGLPSHLAPSGRKYIENIEMVQKKFVENMLFQLPFSHLMGNKIRKGKYLKQKLEELRALGTQVIESRKKESKKPENESFLDNLLQLQKENSSLTDEEIRNEVNTFAAAAFETTGTALQWLIVLLGNHVEIQDNLRNELLVVFGDDKERDITAKDISKLVYTECVIKEALRLFPPGHILF
ncbi:hypothetical protein B4U80_00432, partial [Leptotrombidium deliense]